MCLYEEIFRFNEGKVTFVFLNKLVLVDLTYEVNLKTFDLSETRISKEGCLND